MRRLAAIIALTLLATGCATGPKLLRADLSEADRAMLMEWQQRRGQLKSVEALADAVVEGPGGILPGGAFTFTLRYPYRHPSRMGMRPAVVDPDEFLREFDRKGELEGITIDAFSPVGLPLLRYKSDRGKYELTLPDRKKPYRGTLDSAAGWRSAKRPALIALSLDGIAHMVEGVIGVPMNPSDIRATPDGILAVPGRGTLTRFDTHGGEPLWVEFTRYGSRMGPVRLDFFDRRPVKGLYPPHRVVATFPETEIRVTINVLEWVITNRSERPSGERPIIP